jgi:hypothetical protein
MFTNCSPLILLNLFLDCHRRYHGPGLLETMLCSQNFPASFGFSDFGFFFLGVRQDWVHLVLWPLPGVLYQPRMTDDERGAQWNENWQGKPKFSEKTCPSATLSATNPIWPDLGSNLGRRGGKPATNRLSYGTAHSGTSRDVYKSGLQYVSGHSYHFCHSGGTVLSCTFRGCPRESVHIKLRV